MNWRKALFGPFLIACLSLANLVFAETTNISSLVFTTSNLSVAVGEISEALSVQTQNIEGIAEKVSETNDVEFESTSSTGEFLGATGSPVTTTMSKNTSSRTFYYRDSTAGTHTITIKITGRETGQTFSVSQEIRVGNNENTTGVLDETDDGSTVESTTSSTSSGSSHSSQKRPSEFKVKKEFKTDIGRERIVSVNTPLEFEANTTVGKEEKGKTNTSFYWSFGDGTSGRGKVISHTYAYPGEYVVMMNAKLGDLKSISRTEVKVIEPNVKIISINKGKNGFVEVKNDSSYEVNIGSWGVANTKEGFSVAPDTILKPKTSLKLPFSWSEDSVVTDLKYPTGDISYTFDSSKNKENPSSSNIAGVVDSKTVILKDLVVLKEKLEKAETEEIENTLPVATLPAPVSVEEGENKHLDQSALLIGAFEDEQSNETKGIKNRILQFFRSIFSN